MPKPTNRSSRAHDDQQNVVVFDIGGTWFRSGVSTPSGALVGQRREPALSYHRHPDQDVTALQEGLLEYLAREAGRLVAEHGPCSDAVISMGAALNANTGFVFNSGPLWGARCKPIDLPAELRARAGDFDWHVLNDVTAALLRHVDTFGDRAHGRTALITISSGIACRVYDFARRCVPTDPVHGLQGEIGHLEVAFSFDGVPVRLDCDCGGANHLNAFASGRGLEAVVRHLSATPGSGFESSTLADGTGGPPDIASFLAAANAGDAWSLTVLAEASKPLANILALMLTHDPELDPIVFVGGVAATLGDTLLSTVIEQLERLGMYQIIERDPGYFRERLGLGSADDESGLLGCGLFARHPSRTAGVRT